MKQDLIKEFNSPKYLKEDMSFAEASKTIDKN